MAGQGGNRTPEHQADVREERKNNSLGDETRSDTTVTPDNPTDREVPGPRSAERATFDMAAAQVDTGKADAASSPPSRSWSGLGE